MQTEVRPLNEGRIPTKSLLVEVLPLDRFDEAMMLLKRAHPKQEAFRVTIKHCRRPRSVMHQAAGEMRTEGPARSIIETTKRTMIKKEEKICPKN
jgi:hypothetical protein